MFHTHFDRIRILLETEAESDEVRAGGWRFP